MKHPFDSARPPAKELLVVRTTDKESFIPALAALHKTLRGANVKEWDDIRIAQIKKPVSPKRYDWALPRIQRELSRWPESIDCETGALRKTRATPSLYPRIHITVGGEGRVALHQEARALHKAAGFEYTRPVSASILAGIGFVIVENAELYAASVEDALQAAQELVPSTASFRLPKPDQQV